MSERQPALFAYETIVDTVRLPLFRCSNSGKWHLLVEDKTLCGKLSKKGRPFEQQVQMPAPWVGCFYCKKSSLVESLAITMRLGFNSDFESWLACYDMLIDLGLESQSHVLLVGISQIRPNK